MNKMTENKENNTTNTEGTETGKKTQKDADSVIEVRHVYQTSKDSVPVKDKTPAKELTAKPETGGEESITKTVDPSTKEDKVETPELSVKELQTQLATEKKRREGLELIVEAEATKAFETEKTEFLGLIKDENMKNDVSEKIGDDPNILNEYKRMSSYMTTWLEKAGVTVTEKPETATKDGEETTKETGTGEGAGAVTESTEEAETGGDDSEEGDKTVAGRAVLPQTKEGEVGADSYKAYVDELYNILKDPTKTAGEKEIADKHVNALFLEMTKGMKSTGQYAHLPPISACPNCGYILSDPENETCPRCGWKHMVSGIKVR